MSTYPVGAAPSDAPDTLIAPPPPAVPVGAKGESPAPEPSLLIKIFNWCGRFFVRFGLLYLIIFLIGRVAGLVPIPGFAWIARQNFLLWRKFVPWLGQHVLSLKQPVSLAPSGSGDKMSDWVQFAGMLGLAFVGALIWVWFDRRRRGDPIVHEAVRIGLRYWLGMTMLSYGISKVLWQQMSAPGAYRLFQSYGESSPMGLLWTFMGQSWAYSAFAGGLEFLGGFLLFFRRTTTLGALILIAVMTNVVLMNYAFDVPVKLYSTQYLIFAVVLAGPDLRRLLDVLVLHRPTMPRPIAFPWLAGRPAHLFSVVKCLMILWILWLVPAQRVWTWVEKPVVAKSAVHGIYEVETYTRNGTVVPPLLTEVSRWRRVAIEEQTLTVQLMNDLRQTLRLRLGPRPGEMSLEAFARGGPKRSAFKYTVGPSDRLQLTGTLNGAELSVELKRVDEKKFLLRNRGFFWISEQPFNR